MEKWAFCAILLGMLINTNNVFGITFTSDITLNSGVTYDTVVVENSAVIDMYNGAIKRLSVNDTSEFHLYGGRVGYDLSIPVGLVGFAEESKFYQYGGSAKAIILNDTTEAYIYGGELEYARLYDSSKLDIYGSVDQLYAGGYCDINIYAYGHLYSESDVQHPSLPYGFTYSYLTVFTNSSFTEYYDVWLIDQIPTSTNPVEWRTYNRINFHVIPEPATLSLLTFGSIIILRKRNH